jgi:hypothetical protein
LVVRRDEMMKQMSPKRRIDQAVCGFRIPMLAIPKLYTAMENVVAAGGSDADLKAVVAGFPGVEVAN